jgi:hypothetical protein
MLDKTIAFDVVGTLGGEHGEALKKILFGFQELGWSVAVWSSAPVGETIQFCNENGLKPDKILNKVDSFFFPEIAFDDDVGFVEVLSTHGTKAIKV